MQSALSAGGNLQVCQWWRKPGLSTVPARAKGTSSARLLGTFTHRELCTQSVLTGLFCPDVSLDSGFLTHWCQPSSPLPAGGGKAPQALSPEPWSQGREAPAPLGLCRAQRVCPSSSFSCCHPPGADTQRELGHGEIVCMKSLGFFGSSVTREATASTTGAPAGRDTLQILP